jgi:hypothetical protein
LHQILERQGPQHNNSQDSDYSELDGGLFIKYHEGSYAKCYGQRGMNNYWPLDPESAHQNHPHRELISAFRSPIDDPEVTSPNSFSTSNLGRPIPDRHPLITIAGPGSDGSQRFFLPAPSYFLLSLSGGPTPVVLPPTRQEPEHWRVGHAPPEITRPTPSV